MNENRRTKLMKLTKSEQSVSQQMRLTMIRKVREKYIEVLEGKNQEAKTSQSLQILMS